MKKKLPVSDLIVFPKLSILLLTALAFFTGTFNSKAQTFSNSQQTSIPDPGTVSVPLTVSGLPNQIDTVSYGLQSVSVKITHPATKELTLKLQSPDGKAIFLFRKSQGKNFNTTFDAVSPQFIDNNEIAGYSGSFSGGYRPRQDLALLNNTQNPNGIWNLIVTDDNSASTQGLVTSISLVFGNNPAKPLLSSSTLPIIKIYTSNGNDIVDEPKVLGDIFIINNGAGAYNYANQSTYQYQGKIGIEIRGNSTSSLPTIPKKQYGFETRAADGINSTDVSLFGMPAQSDWILSAVMSDKSLIRNMLTYQIAREMGKWASRTQYCELVINDEYRGVFIFEEKIKKDKNRVPVDKMSSADIADPNVTGGYIFSIDDIDSGDVSWQTKFDPKPSKPYKFVYPKPADLQPAQITYLEKYVGDFETALHGSNFQDTVNGFRKYADDKSFIDFFLINEFGKNADAYRYSTYFYKKRSGKIVAGPVWDFDRSFRNEATCNTFLPSGYIYQDVNNCEGRIVQWWWARLLEDTRYKQDVICRYNTLRQSTLSKQHLYSIIDSAAAVLNGGAQQRNFVRWNIFSKYVDRIPEPYSATYAIEIDTIKQWINNRLNWLDNDLGTCAAPAQYTLSITAANGTVAKNPNLANYTSGTNVTLTATAASGYQFSNWAGDASGTANPLTVSMTANKNITANFTAVPVQYTLSIAASNGTVAKNPDQANYISGANVTLTATPASGYEFSSWSGDASGTENPLTISITGNKSITANFTSIEYTLSVAAQYGTITKSPDQASYTTGTNVTLTAAPASGYQFSNWTSDASGSANPLTVSMTGNTSITAIFTAIEYTLSVAAQNGTITKSPNQSSYINGTDVTLTATPNAGYQFSNWSGDASGSTNPLTVSMTGNKSVTANFTILPADQYTLSVTAAHGTITKSPDEASYDGGVEVTLTATPASGYVFSSWSGDASGNENPLTVGMTGNKSITANFTAIEYTLAVTGSNGNVTKSPDQNSYTSGSSVALTANPASGYQFSNWGGDASGTANPLTVNMTGDKNITANFTVIEYTLAVSALNGTVTKNPDQSSYTSGSSVALNASAASGYQFSNWSGDAGGTENPLTISMTGNKSITANFTAVSVSRYTLSVAAANGTVTKSPDQANYTSGSSVALTASAASGYQFSNWSGDASGTENPLTINMTSNKSITANFTNVTGQNTATLAPVADAFVRNGSYADVNYGKDPSLIVKSSSSSSLSRLTYLKFSLSSVSDVSSAKLRIYGNNTENTSSINTAAYGVNNDTWTETGITWNNAPASLSAVLSSVGVTNQAKYYDLDVTGFVKSQFADDKTASFLLKDPSNQSRNLSFHSRENSTNKPQLIITTTSANQAPVLAAIGNKTITVGKTLTFTAAAADPDAGQTKTFSLINAPAGAVIGATSGAFSWTPSSAGTSTFTVRVTDNGSPVLTDEEQITVTVNNTTNSSLTLAPVADAFVRNGSYADVNYGKDPTLIVKSTSSSSLSRLTYLKFSLSSVSTVGSAKLRIYGNNTENTTSINTAAYGVNTDSWTETGITWNNAPASLSAILSSVGVSNQATYYELDVTSFVKSQLAGDKTASFLIKDPSNQSRNLSFHSRENSSSKPQLIITATSTITSNAVMQREESFSGSVAAFSETKIYPNPAQKKLNIELSRAYKGKVNLQIADESGRTYQISKARLEKGGFRMEADISNLSLKSGIYFLKIYSATKSEVIKFIVQ